MIKIICVGKVKEKYLRDMIDDYIKRISKYHKIEIIELTDSNINKEKEELLRKKSREVEVIDDKTQTLIDDMIDTMYKYNGVGLSAVQVGVLKRVVVIDIDDGNGVITLINPKIIKTKGEQEVEEGCLSFPNQYAKMIRPKEVVVEALDRSGKKITIKSKDLLAY